MIQHDQFFGRIEVLVEQVRDQGVNLAVADPLRVVPRVTGHPHHDPALIPPAIPKNREIVDKGYASSLYRNLKEQLKSRK